MDNSGKSAYTGNLMISLWFYLSLKFFMVLIGILRFQYPQNFIFPHKIHHFFHQRSIFDNQRCRYTKNCQKITKYYLFILRIACSMNMNKKDNTCVYHVSYKFEYSWNIQ